MGAGVGGLATALRLAHRGHRVTVFEKTDQVGGRNRERRVGEALFDAGPTLMMMLDPFRKLFEDVGERLEDHLELVRCDPNYRVVFADGVKLDCTSNKAAMQQNIARMSGPKEAGRFPEMLGDLEALYRESIPQFVRRNYDSIWDLVSLKSLSIALRHRMLGNLAKGIGRYFDDPKLRVLFCLQTMYLGLSPARCAVRLCRAGVHGVRRGHWYPKGGLVEISGAIARLAEAKGAEVRLNSPVCRIDGKTVLLESGEGFQFDAVIVNADLPYAERALLPERKRKDRRYSCSAYMMYLDYVGEIPELLHHNILLGADFDENLAQLFTRFEIPTDPAFYVAISSKTDPTRSVPGHENVFVLVPCPNLSHEFTDADGLELQAKAFARLEKESSFRRGNIAAMETVTPQDWASDLNLDKGAAFGLSHDLLQSVCFRPTNKSREQEGVYFVGASTNPGNGLPMVLIGAELVERRLQSDGLISDVSPATDPQVGVHFREGAVRVVSCLDDCRD